MAERNRTPKGYKVHKEDFGGDSTGWTFETPDGLFSDDAWRLRRFAVKAACEHAADPATHEVTTADGGEPG